MEKKNSGLIVMKILVTLGALILIVGLFLPDLKLGFQKVEVSEEIAELAQTFGMSEEELEKEMENVSKEIREELEEADKDDIKRFEEEYGFNISNLEGNYSYISSYEDVDNAFDVKIDVFKWIIFIAATVFAIAAAVFAWLNIPIVSVISSILGCGASIGSIIFLTAKDFNLSNLAQSGGESDFLSLDFGIDIVYKFKLDFGFFVLVAGGVILLVSAIVLKIAAGSAKKQTAASSENGLEAGADFGDDYAFGFQDGLAMDDQMTVPLEDIPIEPQQMGNPTQNQNAIRVGVLVLDGSMKGVKIPVEEGRTLEVGKDPQMASLVMDKAFLSVSRLHCTISFSQQANQYYVTDNSSNGTFKSDGTRLVKGRKTMVPRQTILYLATDNCKIKLL